MVSRSLHGRCRDLGQRWSHEDIFAKGKTLMFGTFFRQGEDIYSEFTGTQAALVKVLDGYLEEYNMTNTTSQLDLVFSLTPSHIARINRVLRQPRGSALLIGVGGSGKQSLSKLACAMCEYECVSVELKKGYSRDDFQEDMKAMLLTAGVKGNNVGFLLPSRTSSWKNLWRM